MNTTKKFKLNKKTSKTKKLKTHKHECIDIMKIPELHNKDVGYLQNPICKFIPLYDYKKNVKKNIVSCCFFKMRKGGYKNFNKYLNGLKVVSNHIKTELGNSFVLKLFIDYSIYKDEKIMNYIQKIDNVELVLYSCNNFCINEYHLGTFGTLVRMFPVFNLPNNDTNHVIMADIDYDEKHGRLFGRYTNLFNIYTTDELNTVELAIKGGPRNNNFMDYKRKYIIDNVIIPYTTFHNVISFKKINFKSLKNYLNKVFKEHKHNSPYYISNEDRIKKCDKYICFGLDEEYLNSILIPYLIRNKRSILINLVINKLGPFYFINSIQKYDSKFQKIVKNLLVGIMPNIEHSNYNKIYNYFINIFYENNKVIDSSKYNNTQKELIKRLDILYKNMLIDNNTFLVNKDALKIYNLIEGKLRINYIKGYNNKLQTYKLDTMLYTN